MPITTVAETRLTLGIDEQEAYLTFRYPDEAALDAAVTAAIFRGSVWLKGRADPGYYTGSSPGPFSTDVDEGFRSAEEWAAGHWLFPRLKVRRVLGSHFALDQEGSERFEELIDVEFLKLAEEAVLPWLTTDLTGAAAAVYSRGVFDVTEPPRWEDRPDVVAVNQARLWDAMGVPLP